MEEAALVTLEEAEAMEVVDRVMETRAVAMAGVAAMTAITTAEAALAVVVVGIQWCKCLVWELEQTSRVYAFVGLEFKALQAL